MLEWVTANLRRLGPGFAFLFLLAAANLVRAQDQYTRFELGGQFSTIRETPAGGGGENFAGFGGRFDWNFSRRMALESEIDFFPKNGVPLFGEQGGQTLQAVFGLRAKVVQTKRLSVFGLVRPGLLHFTNVLDVNVNPDGTYPTSPKTYFVLNLGGEIEYYVTPRWVLRADIAGNPYRIPNQAFSGTTSFATGKVNDTTRLSFGVAYRPGVLVENEPEQPVSGNWELGPLFSTLIIQREGAGNGVQTDLGLGGFASYRIYGVFYFDSDVLYFPADRSVGGPQDGGQLTQGLFGVKGGIRRNRVGFFGKVRPGFNSFSQAVTSVTQNSIYTYRRSTNFVLDLGGIIELYPNEHSTLRIEAGDTHIFLGTKTIPVDGVNSTFPGGGLRHSMEFIVGYGWRF